MPKAHKPRNIWKPISIIMFLLLTGSSVLLVALLFLSQLTLKDPHNLYYLMWKYDLRKHEPSVSILGMLHDRNFRDSLKGIKFDELERKFPNTFHQLKNPPAWSDSETRTYYADNYLKTGSQGNPYGVSWVAVFESDLLVELRYVKGDIYDPNAHKLMTTEPSIEGVIGQYELREAYLDQIGPGLNDMLRSASPRPTFTLREDGTATFTRFPFFEMVDGGSGQIFVGFKDIEAQWEISEKGSIQYAGTAESKTFYGIQFNLSDEGILFDVPTLVVDSNRVDGLIFELDRRNKGQVLGYRKAR